MITKAYALSVSLAAVIAVLLSAVPLVQSVLEYRSPELVESRPELASVDAFVAAKDRLAISELAIRATLSGDLYKAGVWSREEWEAIYNAERQQHIEAMKQRAGRNCIAYGGLWGLCFILLFIHVPLARRQ